MNRRGFLGSILALGAAPAIVRADSLMRIVMPAPDLPVELQQFVVTATSVCGLTITAITQEALRIAHENRTFILSQTSALRVGDVFTMAGVRMPPKADTLRIRLPQHYKARA